jgi:SAM-dependent methyltransferase
MNSAIGAASKWPKTRPQLTIEQQRVLEDWYPYWLSLMANKFSGVTQFNNRYPLTSFKPGARTLEIGAGLGEHLSCEDLQKQEYIALEMRPNLAEELQRLYPTVRALVGDCEKKLDVPDSSVDRVIAIHVLEHLSNLPAALAEVRRVLRPDGSFSVVIPCEGGLGYALGRMVTSKRVFENRYRQSYEWMIRYDHINRAGEIIAELQRTFTIRHREYWPLRVPSIHTNLVLGLTLQPI